VVIKTFLVSFYLKKLKKIEKELKDFGVNVSINPLPTIRIRFSKGNLFLYKVKLEGKTLYGKDFLNEINTGDLKNIPPRRFFSYLFSGAKELIRNFDPKGYNDKDILYNSAKTIIYCAETLLMMEGLYFIDKKKMINLSDEELRKDFEVALNIINDDIDINVEPTDLWFRAKNHVISTFLRLMKKYYKVNNSVGQAVKDYLKLSDYRFLKNFEYLILTLIIKKELNLKAIFSKKSVEKRMFESLLLLLLSVNHEKGKIMIDKNYLSICIKNLNSFMKISVNEKNIQKIWKNLRNKILENWQYTCSVMGV